MSQGSLLKRLALIENANLEQASIEVVRTFDEICIRASKAQTAQARGVGLFLLGSGIAVCLGLLFDNSAVRIFAFLIGVVLVWALSSVQKRPPQQHEYLKIEIPTERICVFAPTLRDLARHKYLSISEIHHFIIWQKSAGEDTDIELRAISEDEETLLILAYGPSTDLVKTVGILCNKQVWLRKVKRDRFNQDIGELTLLFDKVAPD